MDSLPGDDGRMTTGDQAPRLLAAASLAAVATGGILHLGGSPTAGDAVWAASIAVLLVPLAWSVVRAFARGDLGVDLIALMAMTAALALGHYLAGAVVALMMSGGNALEDYAARRARRELTALVERAPRFAHRRVGEALEEVPVDAVRVGDRVLVRAGEVLPVDGVIASAEAVVDESALTGEPLPVTYREGQHVRSGTANAGEAFDLRATRPAATARTPRWSASCAPRRVSARRSCAWRTATRRSSCPSRSPPRRSDGA